MSSFDEREQGFERKFQHDQELAFKARARRNKLFGLWVAEHLGLSGEEAQGYARALAETDVVKRADEKIVAKAAKDLAKKRVALDAVRLRVELDRFAAEARRQLGGSG
jgi:hypothetical protein